MESCRLVFLAILYSVMTLRGVRCVVASGGRVFQHSAAAHIGLLFAGRINDPRGKLRAAILSFRLLSRHKRTRYIHRCARTRGVRLPRFAKEASAHRSSDIDE